MDIQWYYYEFANPEDQHYNSYKDDKIGYTAIKLHLYNSGSKMKINLLEKALLNYSLVNLLANPVCATIKQIFSQIVPMLEEQVSVERFCLLYT